MNTLAIVVTYNRCALLIKCIEALINQSQKPNKILVIDNASTDNTIEILNSYKEKLGDSFFYERLNENLGGAGGFNKGLKIGLGSGSDWFWIMDDDAEPEHEALKELLKIVTEPNNLYGSIAIYGDKPSWPLSIKSSNGFKNFNELNGLPQQIQVKQLPFLGLLVHRELIKKIGLPEENFFIYADDVEYCMRAAAEGAKIIMASRSRIQHPKAEVSELSLGYRKLSCLVMPAWKRYYDTRNRIFIAKKYHPYTWFLTTIPGLLLRLFGGIKQHPNKLRQIWAFVAGTFDGLFNLSGKRHHHWKL